MAKAKTMPERYQEIDAALLAAANAVRAEAAAADNPTVEMGRNTEAMLLEAARGNIRQAVDWRNRHG